MEFTIQPFSFRTWLYLEGDLETAIHDFEITQSDFININIDYNINGGDGYYSLETRTIQNIRLMEISQFL